MNLLAYSSVVFSYELNVVNLYRSVGQSEADDALLVWGIPEDGPAVMMALVRPGSEAKLKWEGAGDLAHLVIFSTDTAPEMQRILTSDLKNKKILLIQAIRDIKSGQNKLLASTRPPMMYSKSGFNDGALLPSGSRVVLVPNQFMNQRQSANGTYNPNLLPTLTFEMVDSNALGQHWAKFSNGMRYVPGTRLDHAIARPLADKVKLAAQYWMNETTRLVPSASTAGLKSLISRSY